jgi:RNA polymerase sigma-32 factor
MHAVREYNPYKDVRLITYAVWWIRGYIQEYLMKQYSMVKIGTTQNQRKLFYRLQKEKEMIDRLGMKQAVALLSGQMDIPQDEVVEMSRRMSGRDVSLSQPVGDDEKATLMDFQSSATDEGADDALARQEQIALLKVGIEKVRPLLNERELYLLDNRLLADEPLTLQEVGDHYHITREAVRQMESRLLQKIRNSL